MGFRPREPCPPAASHACLPSGVDVSSSALRFLAEQLRRHRCAIGSRWRRLRAGRQDLLTLAHLRVGHTYAELAPGSASGSRPRTATSRRPSTSWPRLHLPLADAVRSASTKAFVLLDGTLLRIDRIVAACPFYSGKYKRHSMTRRSSPIPSADCCGSHRPCPELSTTSGRPRQHGIIDALAQAEVKCWADKGYPGAGGTARIPYWGQWEILSPGQKAVNRAQAKIRALVEQAMATLKSWRLLRKLRCSTTRITALVPAVLALHKASSDGSFHVSSGLIAVTRTCTASSY